jgi:hypothetical protein
LRGGKLSQIESLIAASDDEQASAGARPAPASLLHLWNAAAEA